MRENDAKLNRCKKLLASPPKVDRNREPPKCVDRNKEPPKCRLCSYYQPEFRYRKCLYAACPYGKDHSTTFRKRPLRSEKIVAGGGDMNV